MQIIVPKDVTPCIPVNALSFHRHLHSALATVIREVDGSSEASECIFRTTENKIFAHLECYTASIVSYRRFGTIYWANLYVWISGKKVLEDETRRLSRNVGNYQAALRNIPEKAKSLLTF